MLLEKDDVPLVSEGFMNEVHDEDRKIINEIFDEILKYEKKPSYNTKINIAVLFQKWFNHTVKHFSKEEKKMKKERYPNYKIHKKEHTRTLAEMHTIYSEWLKTNDIHILKTYFTDVLPKWIVEHIETMDREASSFFNKSKTINYTI